MSNFHFTVDTSPMARTIDSVNGHVNGVTAAVAAMEAAVIATERESARTICENVDNGFYVLVKSQISQKAVAAYTEMTAKEMILFQLCKALDAVKRQMDADYQMISRRYAKLFASLNKALENRVRELDRPAMQLAEIKKEILFDKLKDNGTAMICAADDILAVSGTSLAGKLKQKTKLTLKTLSDQVVEDRSYTEKVKCMLLPEGQNSDADQNAPSFLPSVFVSSGSHINSQDYIDTVYTSQSGALADPASIVSALTTVQEQLGWTHVSPEEKESLRKEVVSLIDKETLDERTSKELMRLFDEDNWLALKGNES